MFNRIDPELKFKRSKSDILGCSTITVTWEREKPITWKWTRISAMKGICRAHWDGPCCAENEQQIRDYCRRAMREITEREQREDSDPVIQYWRSLDDNARRKARQNMDWDKSGDAAQQAYEAHLLTL